LRLWNACQGDANLFELGATLSSEARWKELHGIFLGRQIDLRLIDGTTKNHATDSHQYHIAKVIEYESGILVITRRGS
jgi:hypothetical protein